jgi:outer membrane immunogenic protein
MKKSILTIVMFFATIVMFAQCPIGIGEKQLNAGVGLSSWGFHVYVGFDYGALKDISLGGELSFRSYDDKWNNATYHLRVIGISGNGNYHFNRILEIPSKWDFYAGLNLGFYIWNAPDDYNGSHTSGLGLGAQIGGRYYFSDKLGLNLEFGGGNAFSGGKFGITARF